MSSEQIEDIMTMLSELGVNVVDGDEVEEGAAEESETAASDTAPAKDDAESDGEFQPSEKTEAAVDRTDDPVRMYLRDMGSVELLSRECEIAIAKSIQAGRETLTAGLRVSPLTFKPPIARPEAR